MIRTTRTGDFLTVSLMAGAAGLAYLLASGTYTKTAFDRLFEDAGRDKQIEPDMLRAIAQAESSMNPNAVAQNPGGAPDFGLMQINGRTADRYGIARDTLLDPAVSVATAARLLADIRKELGGKFSPFTWIAAYNAGAPAILRRGVFNVTYVSRVMFHWQMFAIARGLR